MEKLIFSVILLLSLPVCAEVYRWTDANGKVHFGDKKPDAKAENITEKVKTTNVDTSTSEHQKLESLFRKENNADREYQQQQKQQEAKQEYAKSKRCADAQQYLNTISGPVQFLDKDGKPVRVTELERQERVKHWKEIVKESCTN